MRAGRHLESCMVAGDWTRGGHTSQQHDAGTVLWLLCQHTFAMFHNHRNHWCFHISESIKTLCLIGVTYTCNWDADASG